MVEGQVVVVTGAAMGIGRHIAHTFAQSRAKVVVADIAPLDNVTAELREMGAEVLGLALDVREEDQVRSMVDRTLAQFGRLDTLVNNAAIVPHFQWGGPRWASIRDIEFSFWRRVIDTNLGGTVLCTKHALRPMRSQGGGHIVNLYGGGQGPGAAAYVVSKEAIRVVTRFMAVEEEGSNVCVVCLSPGAAIATENAPEEARNRMPGPDFAGNRFVLAADLPMEFSGHLVDLKGDRLVIADVA